MAPLTDAFRGSFFLKPYYSCYEWAVNLAAAKFIADEALEHEPLDMPYTLVKACNVSMTALMLFARDPAAIRNVQVAEVGFGAGDMANKGAVGLRIMFAKDGHETELTFVSTHLAAMEWNLRRRNQNWDSIVSGLVFENPKTIATNDLERHARANGEAEPLLFHPDTDKALHDISMYKPGSHLFVAGDLNYRISETSPPVGAAFPALDPNSEHHYPHFLSRDQLTAEKQAGHTLYGLTEAPIHFPPTYKYRVLKSKSSASDLGEVQRQEDEKDVVEWKFATHRWPGWCDRVLYLDMPSWSKSKTKAQMDVRAYDCLPVVRSSDHRAVYLRILVPVLSPDVLRPPEGISDVHDGIEDPRIKLPKAINIEAWDHRDAVKKWEYIIGWSMKFAQSKQGIMLFATVIMAGLGAWWFARSS
jgi:hypothetical protein